MRRNCARVGGGVIYRPSEIARWELYFWRFLAFGASSVLTLITTTCTPTDTSQQAATSEGGPRGAAVFSTILAAHLLAPHCEEQRVWAGTQRSSSTGQQGREEEISEGRAMFVPPSPSQPEGTPGSIRGPTPLPGQGHLSGEVEPGAEGVSTGRMIDKRRRAETAGIADGEGSSSSSSGGGSGGRLPTAVGTDHEKPTPISLREAKQVRVLAVMRALGVGGCVAQNGARWPLELSTRRVMQQQSDCERYVCRITTAANAHAFNRPCMSTCCVSLPCTSTRPRYRCANVLPMPISLKLRRFS